MGKIPTGGRVSERQGNFPKKVIRIVRELNEKVQRRGPPCIRDSVVFVPVDEMER